MSAAAPDPGQPRPWKVWLPPAAATAFFLAAAAALALASRAANGGCFVYAIDDPYIHMATAANVVDHGVFGVTPYAFCAASSSPLYTLLLAGVYALSGTLNALPFVLNLLAAVLCFGVLHRMARDAGLSRARELLLMAAFAVCTPLLPLVFTGMEHTLHLLLLLVLARYYLRAVPGDDPPVPVRAAWVLCGAAALAVGMRYETLFLVVPLAGLLLLQRRPGLALALGLSAAVPILAFGLYFTVHGSWFLPVPVVLKGALPSFRDLPDMGKALGGRSAMMLLARGNLHLFVLTCLLLGLAATRDAGRRVPRTGTTVLLAVAVSILLHLQFADTGWFFRYEAYLVGLGVAAVFLALPPRGHAEARQGMHWRAPVLLAFILAVASPLLNRGLKATVQIVPATGNIYRQQVQLGRFLAQHYPGAAVAANDIGAMNYLADLRCLDLVGLGSIEVARARREGTLDRARIRALAEAQDVEIAVVYAAWFEGLVPGTWTPVATWTIPERVSCADTCVTFYATSSTGAALLRDRLEAFTPALPDGVVYQPAAELDGAKP